ncbi:MAG: HAD family hydrolase [Candidatus Methanoperedenaceae archaeon]|nr:MAG: HAD family hydrolase [Candidatus Methanoperedenaceae archaeon]
MVKALVFDFDGVIIESFDIKTQAFRELFKDSDKVNEIVEYHKQNGGVSRYKKFKYIYKEILKQPLDDKTLNDLGEKFSNLVVEEVSKCPYVPGVIEFICNNYRKLKLFIASGTPEEELRSIVSVRGISKYFKGIYGSPATKSEILLEILGRENINNNEVIFIGDTITDYNEAAKTEVPFIARINDLVSNPLLDLDVPKFHDFYELKLQI